MTASNLPMVKAVRERTFATPRGRYTARVWRPQLTDVYGRWITTWEVLVTRPDKTRIVVARGESAMWSRTLLSTVDAMLFALESARDKPLGTWARSEEGADALYRLELWAMHRRDVRGALRGAQTNVWGEWLGWRVTREVRAAWAKYFGWTFPDGYVKGDHLTNGNPND